MVRLVTAVEAVRRKRKAATRLWVGVEGTGIAVPGGGNGRMDVRYTFCGDDYVVALHATGSATPQKARLLACFYDL